MTRIVIMDGSFDGLMCVVFARYYDKLIPDGIVVKDLYQQQLEAEYVPVETDPDKAVRVFDGLRRIAPDAAENVWYAFANPDESRFMELFQYIVLAFDKGPAVDRYLKLDYVRRVQEMRRYAGMEAHKLHGFVRFAQTKSGVLYGEIAPVNDVLVMVARHFTERLISEAWVIHDVKRKKAAVYDAKELLLADTGGRAELELCPGEEQFCELWVEFLTSVAIRERVNPKLQRQLMPMRYRPYMTEFSRFPSPADGRDSKNDQASLGALTGQTPAHAPQEIHSSALMT